MRLSFLNIVLLSLALFLPISGQPGAAKSSASPVSGDSKTRFFALENVKAGMTGTARTVFSGSESEPFNVKILGVLPNGIGPRQDLIVGSISGGGADRTKDFAGMSGSPVYIDGKLVGAISYAFPFSTEAICGITPIEQMISIFEQTGSEEPESRSSRTYSFSELASNQWNPEYPGIISEGIVAATGPSGSELSALYGQSFKPIATPLSFSGFSKKALDRFSPELLKMGLLPVTGVASGSKLSKIKKADNETLIGGDSVAVELARGDMSIAANGTVTLRDGERIYAFGHPFLSIGVSSLPMSESSVVVVVPSLNNSFKISVAESLVGSMTQDRATGIYGKLGSPPQMIPVKLNLQTSRNRRETLEFEIANDEFLTPLLLNITLFNAITAHERGIGALTIAVDGTINLKDSEPVKIKGRFAGQASTRMATNSVVIPAFNLVTSKFDELAFTGIDLDIKSYDESKTAVLDRISVGKSEVKPGETVDIEAFIRTDGGRIMIEKIPFRIPLDTPFGKLKIVVGDGETMQLSAADQQFVPRDLAELVSTINKVKRNDHLYLQAKRVTTGAIIGASEMPNLPPSVLATLNTSRTSGVYKPTLESIVAETEIARSEYIISGLQQVEITVVD